VVLVVGFLHLFLKHARNIELLARAFSRQVLELARGRPIGPIAIVVGSELEQEMAEAFGKVDAGRPLAIFSDTTKARHWLDA